MAEFADDAVTIVDLAVRQPVGTVRVGAGPWGVVWQPDGRRAWVTNRDDDSVSAIDPAGRTVVETIAVAGQPLGIAVHPSGAPLYVAQLKAHAVAVIDPATARITGTIAVGDGPAGVAVDPAGRSLYVTNYYDNTVSVIDTATQTLIATVPVAHQPLALAVDPDGSKVYVTAYTDDVVSIIGAASHTVVGSIPVGLRPVGVDFTAAGDRAFVANAGADTVCVVDTARDQVVTTQPVGRTPLGVAIDGSGTAWIASSKAGTLAPLDAGTGAPGPAIAVGGTPVAVGKFIGKPADDCPATALVCDDGDPFTHDGCDPIAGCTHQPLSDLAAVAAASATLETIVDGLSTGHPSGVQHIQSLVTALGDAADAALATGDPAARVAARRAVARLLHALQDARRRGRLGAAGARLLDVARAARRELARPRGD